MARPVLDARQRQTRGKQAAKKLRKNKELPAVFYGPNTEPVKLAVNYPELERIIKQFSGENIILDLKIQSDTGSESKSAILKDLQIDPIKDSYLHADFYEISMDREITVNIPIYLVNTPVGVSNGGILQHIKRELAITCLPDKLVDTLEVDVSALDIGDAVHVSDVDLPEGITCLDDGHLSVAVVAAPTVAAEEVEVEEGVAEEAPTETETVKTEEP